MTFGKIEVLERVTPASEEQDYFEVSLFVGNNNPPAITCPSDQWSLKFKADAYGIGRTEVAARNEAYQNLAFAVALLNN